MMINERVWIEGKEVPGPVMSAEEYLIRHLEQWGRAMGSAYSLDRGFWNLKDVPEYRTETYALSELIRQHLYNIGYSNSPSDSAIDRLYLKAYYEFAYFRYSFEPSVSTKDSSLMAIYESLDKKTRQTSDGLGIKTPGKPGKMIKKMFPFAEESFCASFAEAFKELFSEESLIVKSGTDRESFRHCYQDEQTKCKNPKYNRDKDGIVQKSLSGSCMRGECFPDGVHPAEAYASGDFMAFWAETDKGKIAARAVVRIKDNSGNPCFKPGPVYVNSNQAGQVIREAFLAYVDDDGIETWNGRVYDNNDWNGASLLKIPVKGHGSDMCWVPYLDLQQGLEDNGDDTFTICRGDRADITASSTSGMVEFSSVDWCTCDHCGERFDPESVIYNVVGDENYCESCTYSELFYCDILNEYVLNSDTVEVYYLNSRGLRRSETISEEGAKQSDGILWSEYDREYWKADYVTFCESESDYIPNDKIDNDGEPYFISSASNECFPRSEAITLPNGDLIAIEEVDSEHFDIIKEGDSVSLKLKDHLELDENGNVINRQLELEIAA